MQQWRTSLVVSKQVLRTRTK